MKLKPDQVLNEILFQPADANLIIRGELDKYLEKRKRQRRFLTRKFGTLAGVLLLAVGLVISLPRLGIATVYTFRYLQTQRIIRITNKYLKTIKLFSLSKLPLGKFENFSYSDDTIFDENIRYAHLIHNYNSDYYGMRGNLTLLDEQRLFAYIAHHGFDRNDLCHLNQVMEDDSNRTVSAWLLDKVLGEEENSAYFNPVFSELLHLKKLYEETLESKLQQPLSRAEFRSIRREFISYGWNLKSAQNIVQHVQEVLIRHPEILDEEAFIYNVLQQVDQELNIRLGLARLSIGKDYDIAGDYSTYAWLAAGFKGKWIADNPTTVLSEYAAQRKAIEAGYVDYKKQLREIKHLHEHLSLEDWEMKIHNPLKIGLIVKDVGLFRVLRRNNDGVAYRHKGIDLMADEGTPIYPVQDGFVYYVGNDGSGHGNRIDIWHDAACTSSYSHLTPDQHWKKNLDRFTKEGPFMVTVNSRIGSVGTSGNIPRGDSQYGYAHLHLEIREHNHLKNPFLLFQEKIKVIH